MAKKRTLKKLLNEQIAEVIEACYDWQDEHPKLADKAESIIDESIDFFDDLIGKINDRTVDDAKKHFNTIKNTLKETKDNLLSKVSDL
ncbi:MAG: hypothetical protein CR968_02465 [Flavobacteriia bacterium]|nr:MAG: hypothetical protein CR968_02465 [Flavobacteriia bacterium]